MDPPDLARAFARNQQLAPSPVIDEASENYSNSNGENNQLIYLAVYSSVPVYEMVVRGIGVMRRRSDSYMNATQILKVAGVEKGKRTKILEKEVALGVHEKIQGGHGRYQGTWIPYEKAAELAQVYNVAELLAPLLDYIAPPPLTSLASASNSSQFNGGSAASSSRMVPAMSHDGQSAAAILGNAARDQQQQQQQQQKFTAPELGNIAFGESVSRKRARESNGTEEFKRPKFETGSTWVNPNGSIGLDGLEALANGSDVVNGNGGGDLGKLKRSTKIAGEQASRLLEDPQRTTQHKATLKAIFSMSPDEPDAPRPDLATLFPPDLDPDTPIDDNDHTALHWASALARLPIVAAFVETGSDIYRGNNVGETPLIRAVLVTNNSEQDTFPKLLEILGSSLRTVDDASRTVLHHTALVAGVKGRSSSARYYLESILDYLSKNEEGRFGDLIDAQDIHGDTALNIAARVGNRGLVRMLIEMGADKVKPNKLGLRPRDFGVAGADLEITPAEEVIASLRGPPVVSAPVHKSTEVIAGLTAIINSLSSDFAIELKEKSDALDRTRLLLRSAAKNLSEQRNSIALAKEKVALVDEKKLRIKNLERALLEEDTFDWTGRTEVDKTPARPEIVGPGFTFRGPASTLSNLPPGIAIDFETDPLLAPPNLSDTTSFARLTRLTMWYERVIGLLRNRVDKVQGGIEANELKLRRIVSSCCGVDELEVEQILEGLLAALEADGTGLDLARVSAFMTRAKDNGIKSFP